MAIQSITEIHAGRRGSKDSSPNTTLTRRFRVIMEVGDTPSDVLSSAGVPKRRDLHPDNSLAVCQSVNVDQANNKDFSHVFMVTAEYSTLTVGQPPSDDEEANPLTAPIEVSWTRELMTVPMNRGYGTDPAKRDQTFPILSSSHEPFDPGPLRDIIIRKLTIRKNEAGFNPTYLDSYANHVNKYLWWGFLPETVLFDGADATSVWNGAINAYYYQVTYTFKINESHWIESILDRGLYHYDEDGLLTRILDDEDEPYVTPQLLDGFGQVVEPAQGVVSDGFYLNWYKFPRKDLNDLGVVS